MLQLPWLSGRGARGGSFAAGPAAPAGGYAYDLDDDYGIDTVPILHLDASDMDGDGTNNSAWSDEDLVATWADRSGNGLDVTGSGGSRPKWRVAAEGVSTPDGVTKKPAVYFDGSDDELLHDTFFSGNSNFDGEKASLLVVFQPDSPGSAYISLFDTRSTTTGSSGGLMGRSDQFYPVNFITANGSRPTNVDDLSPSMGLAKLATYGVRVDGSTAKYYFYNQEMHSRDAGTASDEYVWGVGNGIYVGRGGYTGGSGAFMKGWIAEILVFNTELSDEEWAVANNYLSNKYDVPQTGAYVRTGSYALGAYSTTTQPSLHFDADDASTLLAADKTSTPADDAAVVFWKSKVGPSTGHYLYQGTGGSQPTRDTSIITSPATRSGVVFDGTDDFLSFEYQAGVHSNVSQGNHTLIYCFVPNTDTYYGVLTASGHAVDNHGILYNSNGNYSGTFNTTRVNNYTDTDFDTTGIQICSVISDQSGNDWNMWKNGGTAFSGAAIPAYGWDADAWEMFEEKPVPTLGHSAKLSTASVRQRFKGAILEVLWYDSALSDTDHNAVLDYFTAKWGATHSNV